MGSQLDALAGTRITVKIKRKGKKTIKFLFTKGIMNLEVRHELVDLGLSFTDNEYYRKHISFEIYSDDISESTLGDFRISNAEK